MGLITHHRVFHRVAQAPQRCLCIAQYGVHRGTSDDLYAQLSTSPTSTSTLLFSHWYELRRPAQQLRLQLLHDFPVTITPPYIILSKYLYFVALAVFVVVGQLLLVRLL
jgi:hypothetical protein